MLILLWIISESWAEKEKEKLSLSEVKMFLMRSSSSRDLKSEASEILEEYFSRQINKNKCEKVIKMQSEHKSLQQLLLSPSWYDIESEQREASVLALLTLMTLNTVKYESCETLSLMN